MNATHRTAIAEAIFVRRGETGALMQARFGGAQGNTDWSETQLGAVEHWSFSLKTAIGILGNAPSPMFLVWRSDLGQSDFDAQILIGNDATASLFEDKSHLISDDQNLGKVQPLDRAWIQGWESLQFDIDRVFATAQPLRREQEWSSNCQRHDLQFYSWSYSPIWNETGQVGGVVATGYREVGENVSRLSNPRSSQSVEARLQQREEQLHLITNALPALIAYVDKDHYYRFNNQTYETWFGRPAASFTDKHVREVLGEAAYETVRPLMDLAFAGERVSFESQIAYSEGGTRYIQADYVPHINADGEVEGYFSLVSDISDRKRTEVTLRRSEERLQLAINVAKLGTWRYHLSTGLVELDERMREIWGEPDDADTISLQKVIERIHPEDHEPVTAAIAAALDPTSLGIYEIEYRILWDDGSERWVSANGQAQFDGEGAARHAIAFFGTALDITDRKQTEASLRESEARFQAIVRNMPGMLYRYYPRSDGSDAFTYVSSGSRELLELEPETILQDSMTIWSLFHPEDLPLLRESVTIAVENSLPWQWEGRLITPSGKLKWIQGKSRPETTDDGMVWDGLLIDITERRQAEQALRESEEWARLAIQVGRLGGWRLHLDTNLVEMDKRMGEIWGESEDAPTVPLPKVLERMHPDDRERVATAVNSAIDPQSSGTYEIEYRLVWDDGTERWVLAKGQAQFEGEGESRRVVDFFGTLLDITDRKQAEEALRNSAERLNLALTAAKLGDWSWSAATDVVTFSEQAAEMFGIPPGPYMTWTEMQKLLHADDRARAWLQVEQAILDRSDYDIEYRVIHGNGVERWIAAKGRAQYDASGQVLGMLGVVQDITQRKQFEAEREQILVREQVAREEAEAANRIKDEFLAVLSHELRSPLNPILGWSKLLQTRQLDEQGTQRALQTIERNAKLQAQLIEDLLDVSRILRGKLSLNVAPVSLVTVIESALETVRLAAEVKHMQIQLHRSVEDAWVSGDAARLQQIVWNLLSNAVKFTPESGNVEVRLAQVGRFMQIVVKDSGKGISPTFLPYVFDYFRQEDSKTTRKFGGLGLGLAIVRHLTELHGGTVYAESPGEGQGATFTIQLPFMAASLEPERTSIDPYQAMDLSRLRILIVDDEADMRELGQFVLEQQGAQVVVAASAAEALILFDRQFPDLVISDIGMPETDGYTLMRKIRSRPPEQGGKVPAIALTAYAGEYDQQQALAAGFQRHLAKPIEPDELLKSVVEVTTPFSP